MAKSLDALFDEAIAAHRNGDAAEAERLCQTVLAADADHLGALYALSVLALGRADFMRAETRLARLLALNPNLAAAHNAHGKALVGLKRPQEALMAFQRASTLEPHFSDAIFNRGTTLVALGRLEEALACFVDAAAIMPGVAAAPALFNQGNVLFDLGRFEDALACYDAAVAREPDFAVTHNNRGNTLRALNRMDEALAAYDRAVGHDPNYAAAYNNRGIVLQYLDRLSDALASYDRAIALQPGLADAFYNRGIVLGDLKRPAEALASLDRAVALRPDHAQAASLAFEFASKICDWRDRPQRSRDLIRRVLAGEFVVPLVVLGACDDPEVHATAARNTAARFPLSAPAAPKPPQAADGRLRIAYVSADFHDHATARLMAEMFERHDRERFELSAISLGPSDASAMRRRIEAAFDHFVDATRLSDRAIVALMRNTIDIAVDLKGYTRGQRATIFAHRVAPLQVNYLGYPGTMGANFIDYIIGDRTVISATAAPFFSESIIYLPDCYQVTDSTRVLPMPSAQRAAFGLPEQCFVFCCFNASQKLTPELFGIWMNLLRQVEGSVLWLLVENDGAAENLRREAAARGVAADRLSFAPQFDYERHLSRLAVADLFLDTLPYNAHTTASDALWAGLPLLTCMGSSFPARVAASLLQAIGLPELVTRSLGEYEQLALSLAFNPDRLAAIRAKLAHNRKTGALFDTRRFCRHLETAYKRMWERYRRGEKPEGFAVE